VLGLNAFDDHTKEQYYVKDILKGRYHAPVNVNAVIEDLLLVAMNQNFVPVTDDRDLFIGIVTRRDILQYYYDITHNEEEKTSAGE
jgi:CBS domain-containing protein